MSETIVLTSSKIFTDAQAKTLPTTPLSIIAAPGVNRIIVPQSALILSNLTSIYTNIHINSVIYFKYTGTAQQVLIVGSEAAAGSVTSVLAVPINAVAIFPNRIFFTGVSTLDIDAAINQLDVINKGIELVIDNQGSGNLTGGNAANSLNVILCYAVVTI